MKTKKLLLLQACIMLFSFSAISQTIPTAVNPITGGNMEDASKWTSVIAKEDAGASHTITFNYTDVIPTGGSGGALRWQGQSSTAWNQTTVAIFQKVTIKKNRPYKFDYLFKDISPSGITNNWFENYYTSTLPVAGLNFNHETDPTSYPISGINFWNNPSCTGTSGDDLFSKLSCWSGMVKGAEVKNPFTIIDDTEGDTAIYIVLKYGISGTNNPFDVVIDNVSLTDLSAVSTINVTGTDNVTEITENGGTLQMLAGVLPETAEDKTVSWTVKDGTGSATISNTGLLTALANGTVTVYAKANDGSNVVGSIVVSISNQVIVYGIIGGDMEDASKWNSTVIEEAAGASHAIDFNYNNELPTGGSGGALRLQGQSSDAWNQTNFTVFQRVTIKKNRPYKFDYLFKDISPAGITNNWFEASYSSIFPVDGAIITHESDTTSYPISGINSWAGCTGTGGDDLFSKLSCWSGIIKGAEVKNPFIITDNADVNGDTAIYIILKFGISGTNNPFDIVIDNVSLTDMSIVSAINVTANATEISEKGGTLQMLAEVLPGTAKDKTFTWAVENGTGSATISNTGLFTALTDGSVTVTAKANDGSNVVGSMVVNISNQSTFVGNINTQNEINIYPMPVSNILNISGANELSQISITNVSGQVVQFINNPIANESINVSSLSSGLYIIHLYDAKGMVTNKLFIKE